MKVTSFWKNGLKVFAFSVPGALKVPRKYMGELITHSNITIAAPDQITAERKHTTYFALGVAMGVYNGQ